MWTLWTSGCFSADVKRGQEPVGEAAVIHWLVVVHHEAKTGAHFNHSCSNEKPHGFSWKENTLFEGFDLVDVPLPPACLRSFWLSPSVL